jgi:predicted ester cyclase
MVVRQREVLGEESSLLAPQEAATRGSKSLLHPGVYFATDHVAHYAGFPSLHGHEDWKQLTSMSYTGFPDTFTTFEDEMAMGDKVVVRYLVRATHKGDFMNMPATGKQVKYTGIAIFRIANGKIAEQWQEADVVGLMQQLGESNAQPLTEPLGQQQTEGLQHQVNVTSPIEEAR